MAERESALPEGLLLSAGKFTQPVLLDYGYPLAVTYVAWVLVVLALFPLCRWYDRYKRAHRDKWWLSYL